MWVESLGHRTDHGDDAAPVPFCLDQPQQEHGDRDLDQTDADDEQQPVDVLVLEQLYELRRRDAEEVVASTVLRLAHEAHHGANGGELLSRMQARVSAMPIQEKG